jgi:hypothetical protein
MRLRIFFVVVLVFVLPLLAVSARADALGTLAADGFVVLGASTVTNTGATTLNGNLGLWPGTSLTGSGTITITGVIDLTNLNAQNGQAALGGSLTELAGMAPLGGAIAGGVLDGMNLTPNVYTVSAAPLNGGFNLSAGGLLILNAAGLTNPEWVFQMSSTLITGSGSAVEFINAPSGFSPTVYWEVGSSATLGTTTSFVGNIYALTSITLDTNATIGCGSALANTAAVTMDTNTISTGCSISSTGTVTPTPGTGGKTVFVPEPGTLALLSSGLLAMLFLAFRKSRVSSPSLSC